MGIENNNFALEIAMNTESFVDTTAPANNN
jgi:hypothetical protein